MFSTRLVVKMDEKIRVYTAENGELRHSTGDATKGEIDDKIRRDRKSRLLLQYDPSGILRYYFYAKDKGRPEQYIAEYRLDGAKEAGLESDKKKRDRFISDLFPDRISKALDALGYEIDETHWESEVVAILENRQHIDRPDMSDDAKMALQMGASAEVAVPDMESALWILFNVIGPESSVIISEGGYLNHRGEDDFLIQVDRMKNKVEPIESSKKEIDKSILRKKKKESKSLLKTLNKKTLSRRSGASELADALANAGVTDRLGIDVYSESRKSVIRSRSAALTLLAFVPVVAVAAFIDIIPVGGLIDYPVILGEPLPTVLGPFGPYIIRSYWVLFIASILLLYYVISRGSIIRSVLQTVLSGTRRNTASGGNIQSNASRLVDNLAEVRRRGSTQDVRGLLREGTPPDLIVDRDSRSSFRRKNILVGLGIGAFFISFVVLAMSLITEFFSWSTLMQVTFIIVLIVVVSEVIRIATTLGGSRRKQDRGW